MSILACFIQTTNHYLVLCHFGLLNHMNNVTRNEDVEKFQFQAKFQIAMVSCLRIIWSQLPVTAGGFELQTPCIRALWILLAY